LLSAHAKATYAALQDAPQQDGQINRNSMLRLSFRGKSRQKSVSMPNWAFALMAAGSAALGIALFLVVSTIAVLLLPIVLIGGAIAAYVMRKRIEKMLKTAGFQTAPGPAPRKRAARKPAAAEIEDVEYRVVSEPPRGPSSDPGKK
jgi:hypothetical protein